MTLAALRARTRALTGDQYEISGLDDGLLNDWINEALGEICAGRLVRRLNVNLPNGELPLLTAPLLRRAIALTDAAGNDAPFRVAAGVLYAQAPGAYTLIYLGQPDALSADADEPQLPEELHSALADYAAWRELSRGGRARSGAADYFFARFQLAAKRADRYLEAMLGPEALRNRYR